MSDTGYLTVTANHDDDGADNGFDNPNNVHTASDAAYAEVNGSGGAWFWGGIATAAAGAGIVSSSTIDGIEILVRSADQYGDNAWWWQVGCDVKTNTVLDYTRNRCPAVSGNAYSGAASFSDFVIGGPTDKLGWAGDADDILESFADGTGFHIMVQKDGDQAFPRESWIAYIQVKIYFTNAGGGSGEYVPVLPQRIYTKSGRFL